MNVATDIWVIDIGIHITKEGGQEKVTRQRWKVNVATDRWAS